MRLADIRKVMTLTGMGNVVYLLLGIGKPGKSRDLEKCHFLIRVLVDLVRLLVKIGGGVLPWDREIRKISGSRKVFFLFIILSKKLKDLGQNRRGVLPWRA